MRTYLLPKDGTFFKANLHCHTTVSDGKATPEEVKALYKKHGYSIVAFTDHNIMIPHPELRDKDFLPLTGVEYNVNAPGYPGKHCEVPTTHLCMVATRDDIRYQTCYTDSYVHHGAARDHIKEAMIDPNEPDFERTYTPECVNKMIAMGREKGFFVTYNHPTWSQHSYPTYMAFEGMHAMEIYNNSCWVIGHPEYNSRIYDDMLNGGKHVFAVAADDNHNKHPDGNTACDACGGFVMIKADKLEVNEVGAALLKGNFYASTGPEIKELWLEGNALHVETSEARRISVVFGAKKAKHTCSDCGTAVTSGDFEIDPYYKWFRVHVEGFDGTWADSNAYFTDELPFEWPAE